MMKFDRKPPLPKSPTRLRSRRVLRSNSASLQTPPGSLTKSVKPIRAMDADGLELKPEYRSMSCELRALSKKVRDELGNGDPSTATLKQGGGYPGERVNADSCSLFERGMLYDEYSARRNERLRRKKAGGGEEDFVKTPYRLGVTVESSKKRESKKMDSLRKSAVSSAYGGSGQKLSAGGATPRYLLRSMCKESQNNKPTAIPLPPLSFERSAIPNERRIGVRRSVRNV
ncbi:hypothetical protein LINPERPRIM_LOCUS29737 [Linum perenne]